ncbi:MAG: glycosyltransferase [Spirulinaceae cyanobacterium]
MPIATLLYLSDGKLPSPMADSIQIAKMSQAFGQQLGSFELITSGDWRSLFSAQPDRRFAAWYGLQHPCTITRLPILWRLPEVFDPWAYAPRGYIKAALLYCAWRKFWARLRRSNFVIYTRTPFLVPLLLKQNQRVVLEFHEPLEPPQFDPRWFAHPQFLGLVTLATELAEGYQAQGLPPEQVCLAPSAAEISAFLPEQHQDAARQQLGLPSDRPILAYAGQLYDYKGIPLMLDLAAALPDFELLLIGGAMEDIETVRSRCRERNLTNVRLVGHVSQQALPGYLYAADILLLPTSKQWELASTTSPLKLFDYMAVRRPIVAADLPNVATVLRDGVNGRLAEADNVAAFRGAIADLLANPAEAQRFAQQAYADVQKRTWGDRARHILQFIEGRLVEG